MYCWKRKNRTLKGHVHKGIPWLRVVQYTRTESGRLFGKDDPSSGRRVVVFAEVKKQEIVSEVSGDCEGD